MAEIYKKIIRIVSEFKDIHFADRMLNSVKTNDRETFNRLIDRLKRYKGEAYNEIVEFVTEQGKASASLLQRRFRLGYNRAARCIDLLEERGIVGPANGSKPREVLSKKNSE